MKQIGTIPTLALCAALVLAAGPAQADPGRGTAATGTAVSNAAGTIVQVNYNDQGVVNGLFVSSTTLLSFPGRVCGGVSALGSLGQAVTYSGTAYSNTSSGIQTVRVSALTNTSSGTTYTAPTAPTSTAYPATAGTVTRLNVDEGGNINGFLFTPSGSSTAVLVKLGGGGRNSTLTALLQLGAVASVTGTTTSGETACGAAAVSTVSASSLTIGGQTFNLSRRAF